MKARLFVSTLPEQRQHAGLEYADGFYCEALDANLVTLPNVFSPDALDNGSRLLIDNLPRLEPASRTIDLACGSGVIGLSAYRAGVTGNLLFCDESAMAVRSARENAARLFPQSVSDFSFFQGDGLAGYQGPAADLILCNPPFHLENAVDAFAGRRLLHQAGRHLGRGGRLCLVANRHLDYLPVLRRHFQRVQQLAQNRKFRVYLATKG